jgi:hypothetical protein
MLLYMNPNFFVPNPNDVLGMIQDLENLASAVEVATQNWYDAIGTSTSKRDAVLQERALTVSQALNNVKTAYSAFTGMSHKLITLF